MPQIARRRWFQVAAAGCLIALGVLLYVTFWSRPSVNVLIITLDTTRADRLGCYGYKSAKTPVIDRLAAEGVLFERAYTPAPLTLPAHATLFSGLYPPEHGLVTNGRGSLPENVPTLASIAQSAGFETGAFVASYVVDAKFGLARGFTTYDDDLSGAEATDDAIHRQRPGEAVVDSALKWLQQSRSAPFLCWVHLYDPHFPYLSHADEFGEQFEQQPYDGEIAHVDRQIERLLKYLDDNQLADNTLVLIVGDHGEGLGEHVELTHGYTLYNATQHVPLLLRWPGRFQPGLRIPSPVSLVDVLPSLLAELQLSPPAHLSGVNFSRALRGDKRAPTECYSATDDPFLQNSWSPLRSLTTERWKYIRTTEPELYDLLADPGETRNLAQQQPDELQRLDRRLAELESRFQVQSAASVQLSASERRALQSLGYVSGGGDSAAPPPGAEVTLPDVKEMLPLDVATQSAIDLLHGGNTAEAIAALEKIVARPQHHLYSRIYLGEALEQSGQLPEAIARYEAALAIKPDSIDALIHLGAAQVARNRVQESLAYFDKALSIDRQSTVARYNLGLALHRLGNPNDAVTQFEEVLRLDPDYPNVRTALGNSLLQLGQRDEALRNFEAEVERNPRAVEARINLAALWGDTRPEDSERLLKEALKLDPGNPQIHYNLGALYLMEQRPQEAIPSLEKTLELMPRHPRAAQELERARKMSASPK